MVLLLPPSHQPSPEATAPTDPLSQGGGGTESQEAEQEVSPAAASSWGKWQAGRHSQWGQEAAAA